MIQGFTVCRLYLSIVRAVALLVCLVPTPHDPRPGRFVRHLDFNHFRTIGMRRLVEEGVTSRFVTGDRVECILKVSSGITLFRNFITDGAICHDRKCPT